MELPVSGGRGLGSGNKVNKSEAVINLVKSNGLKVLISPGQKAKQADSVLKIHRTGTHACREKAAT